MKTRLLATSAMLTAGLATLCIADAGATDALEAGFRNPPNSARPQTWYHLMNGNVTKEGITRDFEELAQKGIGGVQMFDVGCDIPPGGLDFNSPEWFDLFRHAAKEARRLGLEICIPNCSGWSSSGGPWNPPSNSMKRVTFSRTDVTGPRRVELKLPREKDDHGYYADIGVFALPTPAAEKATFPGVKATIAADGASFVLTGDAPFTARGFSYTLGYSYTWCGDAELQVEASDDGVAFRPLETFRIVLGAYGACDFGRRYHALPKPTTAKALRAKIVRAFVPTKFLDARAEAGVRLTDLAAKTFAFRQEVTPDATATTRDQVVMKEDVRDVTANMSADGTLAWDVPEGDWTILRFGSVCTGRRNAPASDHGVGLEVDKLSAAAMDYHFEQYVARLCRALGPLAGAVETGFNHILVDSFEVGSQNWTQAMEREFRQRRGYSLRRFMPAFAGFVIDDVATTERFLEDFRRVVADLFAEGYSGALARKCHEYGLKLSLEPYGNCPADNLQYGEYCDLPMSEFWSHDSNPHTSGAGNSSFAASIAHVWGKPIVGAEAFTASPGKNSGRWLTTPASIKDQGDEAYADGVNRIIYHRFTHQPWADDRHLPGMTMGPWGIHLDRTQTWWDFSAPWFAYQARCQFLLQQGTFCADVLFFAGEEAPNHGGSVDGCIMPDAFHTLPCGFASDTCPTDAMYRLRVDDEGRVVAPGGVRYRLLAIPPFEAMSPEMAAQIAKLVADGATVVWPKKPVRTPGLKWGADGDTKVRATADALWTKGGVIADSPSGALAKLGVTPDVKVEQNPSKAKVKWIHRRDAGADWYFIASPTRQETSVTLSFRQTGRLPELWDAETATCAPAERWHEQGGRTFVEVPLTVCGSKFIVFRRASNGDCAGRAGIPPPTAEAMPVPVSGAWTVRFPQGYLPNQLAAAQEAETVVFDQLASWHESANVGVRYFSGTATYEKSIPADVVARAKKANGRVMLDLGEVREFAEVTANGKLLATLWKPPFRVDVTDAIADGRPLDLRIRVTNLWANRLIGDDVQFADDCEWMENGAIKEIPQWVKDGKKSPTGRCTFTTWKHWRKTDELLPSGLLGPVRLLPPATAARAPHSFVNCASSRE